MIDADDLWNACKTVLTEEGHALEVWRVAKATGLAEETIISTLIRKAEKGRSVTFRFPPLPCAAILKMD